jgi:hypothetical protein
MAALFLWKVQRRVMLELNLSDCQQRVYQQLACVL